MKTIKYFLLLTLVVFVMSCESTTYDKISQTDKPVVTNPTYQKNIKPIMTSNCTSCHATGTGFPNLDNFTDVKLNCDTGNVLCRIDNPTACSGAIMPTSGRLPQATIDLIKLWKTQGFVN